MQRELNSKSPEEMKAINDGEESTEDDEKDEKEKEVLEPLNPTIEYDKE